MKKAINALITSYNAMNGTVVSRDTVQHLHTNAFDLLPHDVNGVVKNIWGKLGQLLDQYKDETQTFNVKIINPFELLDESKLNGPKEYFYVVGGYKGMKERYGKRITPFFHTHQEALHYKQTYGNMSTSLQEGEIKSTTNRKKVETSTLEDDKTLNRPLPKQNKKISDVSTDMLNGMDYHSESDAEGLNKPVAPNEIYEYVTQLMINTIKKVGHLPWQKEWKGATGAKNYVSNKLYSGINYILLNFDFKYDSNGEPYLVPIVFKNPYYLTFAQIEDSKAQLKQGSKARRVLYYTMIFNYIDPIKKLQIRTTDKELWKKFKQTNNITLEDTFDNLTTIPVLKYYNVYRADDCTGLDFSKRETVTKTTNPITEAQSIIDHYPNPPKFQFGGDGAAYYPKQDMINMPSIESFNDESFYYSTFFHEMIHSTGHSSRLDRKNDTRKRDNSTKDKSAYAFEELVAELGAVYLCGESGILFHTLENSAKYLNGWNQRLIELMQKDNRFFVKAAAKAQAGADYILDKDDEGVPSYLKDLKPELPKVEKPKVVKLKVEKKPTRYEKLTKELADLKAEYNRKKETARHLQGKKKWAWGITTEADKKRSNELSNLSNKINAIEAKINRFNSQPTGYAKKPKSVSIQTAIKDILTLPKYSDLKPLQASVLYSAFKEISEKYENSTEIDADLTDYQLAILKNVSYDYYYDLAIQDKGLEFITSVKNRLESLKNQKNNFALFDNLNGAKKVKTKKSPSELKTLINTIKTKWEISAKTIYKLLVKYAPIEQKEHKTTTAEARLIVAQHMAENGPDYYPELIRLEKKLKAKKGLSKPDVVAYFTAPITDEPEIPVEEIEVIEPITIDPAVKVAGLKPVSAKAPNQKYEIFAISGPIGKFLGQIEKKPTHSVAITIDAKQGAGKTRFTMQLANALAKAKNRVLFVSLEEHPDSKLFHDKIDQYISPEAKPYFYTLGELENGYDTLASLIPQFDVVIMDSWNKILEFSPNVKFDRDLRKAFNGKLFVAIFQRTQDGKMRGGSNAQFDGDIITKVETDSGDFKLNYVFAEKNRYNSEDLTKLKYNIYNQIIVQDAPESTVKSASFIV